jgi:hypothetical protein
VKALRKLVLGETWALPIGVAVVLAGGLVLKAVGGDFWEDDGGFLLLAGAVVTLSLALRLRR